MSNQLDQRKNKHSPVEKSRWGAVRIRFETLFTQFGKTRSELTHFLGWDKARTSRVVNGQEIPNLPTRVKIASFFGVDTASIWENPECLEVENGKFV